MSSISSASSTGTAVRIRSYLYYRHTLAVRIMHWINVIALTVLFLSGLNIFSAHPALYWGKSSYTGRGPVFEITAQESDDGVIGLTRLLGREWVTTGVMGASAGADGDVVGRTFPSWLTIPSNRWLSMARRWHFFFAWVFVINGLCYLAYSIATRHFARDLALTATDWRSIGRSVHAGRDFNRVPILVSTTSTENSSGSKPRSIHSDHPSTWERDGSAKAASKFRYPQTPPQSSGGQFLLPATQAGYRRPSTAALFPSIATSCSQSSPKS